jgi:DNA-binding NtrC family response regulator
MSWNKMSRILIVDDEKPIRRIVSVLLTEQGHEVAETESGEEALERQVNFQRELGLAVKAIAPEARRLLLDYDWPGNVRELENELQRLVAVLPAGATIRATDLSQRLRPTAQSSRLGSSPAPGSAIVFRPLTDRVAELEQTAIREALAQAHNNITQAAPLLGLTRKGLQLKLKRYHIEVSPSAN